MSNGGACAGEITKSLVPYQPVGWIVTCRRGGNRVSPLDSPSSILGELVDCKPDVWRIVQAWGWSWPRVVTWRSTGSLV